MLPPALVPFVALVILTRVEGLQVCRNLGLDMVRGEGSPTLTAGYAIGDSGANSDDSDVSALLDPHDNTRLTATSYFELELTPSSTQLASLNYTMEVGGISSGIVLGESDMDGIQRTGDKLKVPIPTSSYVNPNQIPWTDMRGLSLTFR